MNFEDLQKQWGGQFKTGGGDEAQAKLLKSILQKEARFQIRVRLLIVVDLILVTFVSWHVGLTLIHGESAAWASVIAHRYIFQGGSAVIIGLMFISLRLGGRGGVLSSPVPSASSGTSYPGLICRDGTRFHGMVLWRDVREAVTGAWLVFILGAKAWNAPRYQALDWTSAALVAAAMGGFVVYRLRSARHRPLVNDSMRGLLQWSMDQTRRQITLLENVHWYIAPIFLAIILVSPVQHALAQGVSRSDILGTIVMLVFAVLIWRLNRWTARTRLRPRLESLQKLALEFSQAAST